MVHRLVTVVMVHFHLLFQLSPAFYWPNPIITTIFISPSALSYYGVHFKSLTSTTLIPPIDLFYYKIVTRIVGYVHTVKVVFTCRKRNLFWEQNSKYLALHTKLKTRLLRRLKEQILFTTYPWPNHPLFWFRLHG